MGQANTFEDVSFVVGVVEDEELTVSKSLLSPHPTEVLLKESRNPAGDHH
jgi:hypothetical protein